MSEEGPKALEESQIPKGSSISTGSSQIKERGNELPSDPNFENYPESPLARAYKRVKPLDLGDEPNQLTSASDSPSPTSVSDCSPKKNQTFNKDKPKRRCC